MKVLYVAEICGRAGIHAVKHCLKKLKKESGASFVIACGDGATGGNGLGLNHAAWIRKLGADVITLGECCFYRKDLVENMAPWVLRPENLNPEAPGSGAKVFGHGSGKIAVAVLLGQSGFLRVHGENPFSRLPALLERLRRETPCVIVDFHAQATAEKQTLFALADGLCSAVIGSHTRVQTRDAAILPGGTAVICDAGRTGSAESVGGADQGSRIAGYLTGIPDWTRDALARPELQGVLVDIGADGRARSIEAFRVSAPELSGPAGTEKAAGHGRPGADGAESENGRKAGGRHD